LLVCPNFRSFLDVCQGRIGVSRAVVRRRLSDLSLSSQIDRGGLCQGVKDPGWVTSPIWVDPPPPQGVWGRGSQVVMHLGFVVDTKRGKFGVPAQKLDNISERARKLLVRASQLTTSSSQGVGNVCGEGSKSQVGCTGYCCPPAGALHIPVGAVVCNTHTCPVHS
jgi:hypothetical protein